MLERKWKTCIFFSCPIRIIILEEDEKTLKYVVGIKKKKLQKLENILGINSLGKQPNLSKLNACLSIMKRLLDMERLTFTNRDHRIKKKWNRI